MAKGSEGVVGFFSRFEFSKVKNFSAGIPLLIIGLSFPQFAFDTVWSPSISHWENFRGGTNMIWLNSQRPGFKDLHDFVNSLPKNPELIFFEAEGTSKFPGRAKTLRSESLIFYSHFGAKISDEHLELLKTDFWKFFNEFLEGRVPEAFSQEVVDRILKENGDILVFNFLRSINLLGKSRYTKLENLVYSTLSPPGVHRGYVVFALNEELFPFEQGIQYEVLGPGNSGKETLNQSGQFMGLSDRLENPANNNTDVWAAHDRYIYNVYDVPEMSKKIKIRLDFKLDGILGLYPGVQLNWLDLNNQIIKMSSLGVMYEGKNAATFAVKDIPEMARKVAVIVRPNKNIRIAIKEGKLLFVP